MKRALSAILVVILCLSLCACSGVKQEDYDAAIAKYDALAEEHEALKEKFEPYAAVIDALEAEDYDGAVEAVEALRPAPEVTEVEITMDNLWDYFEITEKRTEQADANGNLTQVSIYYVLSLKEEYLMAVVEEYPTDVTVGFEYDQVIVNYRPPFNMDFENFTADKEPDSKRINHQSKSIHFPQSTLLYDIFASCPVDQTNLIMSSIYLADNFEILNASGTLYLVNK